MIDITDREQNGYTVTTAVGNLDDEVAVQTLKLHLAGLIDIGRCLIIDLKKVGEINPAAVAMLQAFQRMTCTGDIHMQIRLLGLAGVKVSPFERFSLAGSFRHFRTEEDAAKSFEATAAKPS